MSDVDRGENAANINGAMSPEEYDTRRAALQAAEALVRTGQETRRPSVHTYPCLVHKPTHVAANTDKRVSTSKHQSPIKLTEVVDEHR